MSSAPAHGSAVPTAHYLLSVLISSLVVQPLPITPDWPSADFLTDGTVLMCLSSFRPTLKPTGNHTSLSAHLHFPNLSSFSSFHLYLIVCLFQPLFHISNSFIGTLSVLSLFRQSPHCSLIIWDSSEGLLSPLTLFTCPLPITEHCL